MAIQVAKCYQQYPQVPLKELTGFYTVGNHQFDATPASGATPAQTHRVAVLSMLPKTLMIHDALRFNNRYVLFAEAVDQLTSVTWTADLYLNGVKQPADDSFLKVDTSNSFELNLSFTGKLLAANGQPRYDKLLINCEVKKGTKTIQLSLQHQFARALDAKGLSSGTQSVPFMGAPETFYFIENNIKEFFPDEQLKWNGQPIASDQQENAALMVLTLSILYYSIQTSQTMRFELLKEMNIDDLQDPELLLSLLMNRPYKGQLRVGFGNLPLHILNQAMTNLGTVPNFAAIPNTNKIFAILADTTEFFYNEAEAILLNRIPDRLLECRTELLAAPDRAFSLYWMAMFPKSAICMTAIMVKFLFEASKKNTFKECKNKKPEFSQATLATYKEHPDLFRNILTHYYQDPHSKVKTFSKDALKVVSLAHSPYPSILYTVNNPRILSAYFAKRVVREIGTSFCEIDFERVDNNQFRNSAGFWVDSENVVRTHVANQQMTKPDWDNFLGREAYLIVETWCCKPHTVQCSTLVAANTFSVGADATNQIRISYDNTYGYTASINRLQPAVVCKLNTNLLPGNNQDFAKEFLEVNHASKFVSRIIFRPETAADFDQWTNDVRNRLAQLTIKAKLANNTRSFFGNKLDELLEEAIFLGANDHWNNSSRYQLANKAVYHVHDENDFYNILTGKIGRIGNAFVNSIQNSDTAMRPFRTAYFIYFDRYGNEHLLCDCVIETPKRRRNGAILYSRPDTTGMTAAQATQANQIFDTFLNNYPANGNHLYRRFNGAMVNKSTTNGIVPMEDVTNQLGESRHKYYCSHDNQTTYPAGQKDEYDQITVRGINGNAVVSYEIDTQHLPARVEIVRMPDELNYGFKIKAESRKIRYTFTDTHRRYANPGAFAAFIGVLASLNFPDLVSTGMCFEDATSYPSVSHPNGDSIDSRHRLTPAERTRTVSAFRTWYFTQIISGQTQLGDGADFNNAQHNNHLHSGEFDLTQILPIIH